MSDNIVTAETLVLIAACAGSLNQKLYQLIELQSKQIQVPKQLLGKQPRPRLDDKRVIARLAHDLERNILELSEHIVTVDSLRRWYRDMNAATYTAKTRGRPPLTKAQRGLIISFAKANPTWDEDTIADRLRELGHDVHDRTVGRFLRAMGFPPAPERSLNNTWDEFITENFAHLIAIDCATWEVPDLSCKRTVRHYALYAIRLESREVRLLGITDHATGAWTTQCVRNLVGMGDDPFIADVKHVIMDNDPIFTEGRRSCFRSSGIETSTTEKGKPWMNGYIERFIGTTRNELRGFIPLSTDSLWHALQEQVSYYNHERTHQRTDGRRPPKPLHDRFTEQDGKIICRSRLGKRLNSYVRVAA